MANRDGLGTDKGRPGFPVYTEKHLDKVNSMRVAKSQPDFHGIPIIHKEQVGFCTASEIGNVPASCSTCQAHQERDASCKYLGPDILARTVTVEGIEYWPCCGMHDYGKPNSGEPCYSDPLSTPEQIGLIWINAPEEGLEYGGANCGGGNGGDDCDHYMVESGEKWDSQQGTCRALDETVANGDVCALWWDDDILGWQEAQNVLKRNAAPKGTGKLDSEQEALNTREKKKLAKQIIGGDDK
jgi:hypothetical protein